ncbi:hypothetical protein GCWU000324_02229 [Kingella oralis ATCC 51147]|uniref:Uncharacterized protein n=1 Tax=Kingella oralis ATCC 51147 TaxID=629741 RepID=C4GJK7_9NEIS|nr:hypothetical protein GCWU000324_02229 [Kingella oralis ATCC 51147]
MEYKGSLKMGCCFVVSFGCSFNHALHASGTLTFLCFAKKSKQRKATPTCRFGCAKLPEGCILFSARAN